VASLGLNENKAGVHPHGAFTRRGFPHCFFVFSGLSISERAKKESREKFGMVTHPQALRCPDRAAELHGHFRRDKSPQSFAVGKFRRSGHERICPVKRSISALHHCCLLGVGPLEPVGVVKWDRAATSSWKCPHTCLKSKAVVGVVRQVVIRAHPDPTHQLHLPENHFLTDCHSNRVTAAVALHLAGEPIDVVAFRLRWNPVSVKHCLRECSRETG
jgi:hypothetical protein